MGRILIVEDQIEVRRMLRAALETLRPGFSVTDIPSGEEALLLLSRQAFDLAVFDVRLAGISGLDLLGKARQLRPDLKVILITGLADPALRQRIANAGADDFFFKPVEIPDFIKAVDYCIGQAQGSFVSNGSGGATIEKQMEPGISIPSLLTILREQIEASCVLLVDQSGMVLYRSGNLPGDLAEPPLVSLGAGAARISSELSGLLGLDAPQDLLCFSGRSADLIIFRSGWAALLAVVNVIAGEKSRAARLRQAQPLLDEIFSLLTSSIERSVMEKSPMMAEIDAVAVPEVEGILDLEDMLNLVSRENYEAQDIQAFWELEGAGSEREDQIGDGRLSFEQARLLGLTPDD